MNDYIVVGGGLAGICFTEMALQRNKRVLMIDSGERTSSLVAGGMYNPVVLKRFTEIWKAEEQLKLASHFYTSLENKLGLKFDYRIPLYRKIWSIEEQNNWFCAADKPNLSKYLISNIHKETISGIKAAYGFGEVNDTGYVNTKCLIEGYRNYLKGEKSYLQEQFQYAELTYTDEKVSYKGIEAKHIVFAEGFGMQSNPFFKSLPLDGTKGELLVIRVPGLNLEKIIKSTVFIIPIGGDLYKVGATYNWEDKSEIPTKEGRDELIKGLDELLEMDYEIVDQIAGVRPTVKDRRPLVGESTESDRIHILNGLGTRGVLLGPFLAEKLLNHIEDAVPLEDQVSIARYKKRM